MSNLSSIAYAQTVNVICQVRAVDGTITMGICPKQPQPAQPQQGVMRAQPQQGVMSTLFQGSDQPRWCRNPNQSQNEVLICSDATLSALDLQLNVLANQLKPRPRLAEDRDAKVATVADKRTAMIQWYQSATQQLQSRVGSGTQGQVSYAPFSAGSTSGGIPWCSKANLSQAEERLCLMAVQNPQLVQLEAELNAAYKSAKKSVKSQQKTWLAQRDALSNAQEVIALYIARIEELKKH